MFHDTIKTLTLDRIRGKRADNRGFLSHMNGRVYYHTRETNATDGCNERRADLAPPESRVTDSSDNLTFQRRGGSSKGGRECLLSEGTTSCPRPGGTSNTGSYRLQKPPPGGSRSGSSLDM
ncbi:hypothetical protein J6590_101691 [Homalodisca vitripennis]|nr:hypothetical protein J6590_101691 [Homalodisca vitripennis]